MKAATKIKCSAPSKIILSGEHSVVHGAPALSFTINQKSTLLLKSGPALQKNSAQINITLTDLAHQCSLSWTEFEQLAQNLADKFLAFQQGKLPIEQVCISPLDLPLATLYEFSKVQNLTPQNLSLSYSSNIWQNRGLGSSAALITSLICSLKQLTNSQTDLLALAQKAESYQHGKSSGLDPATLLKGGLLKYQNNKLVPIPNRLELENLKLWLVDTGKAESSTGETVAHTSKIFAQNPSLLKEFSQTTQKLEISLTNNCLDHFLADLAINQTLLEKLEIVPQKVKNFVQEAKKIGVAKQCGAGSLRGDAGGVVLLISKTEPKEICHKFGYNFAPLTPTYQGVSCEMVG